MILELGPLHFIRPGWLCGLLPLVFLCGFLKKYFVYHNPWRKVCDEHLLSQLMKKQNRLVNNGWLLLCVTWMLAIFALAGPAWLRAPEALYNSLQGRVIVLNLSSSMELNDLSPSRYERAKFKIIDLLRRPYPGQTGFIAYAGNSYVVSPLTLDVETIITMLPELNPSIMPVKGNATSEALTKAVALLNQSGLHNGDIVLVTAGLNKNGEDEKNVFQAAEKIHAQGYKISVLGVGLTTQQNSQKNKLQEMPVTFDEAVIPLSEQLDIANLKSLANAGGGNYVTFTNDDTDLEMLEATNNILGPDNKIVNKKHGWLKSSENTLQWKDEGPWLVVVLLIIVLFGFRRGWLEVWAG